MNYQIVFKASDTDFGIEHIVPILLVVSAIVMIILLFKAKIEEKHRLFARSFSIVFFIVTFIFMISDLPENISALNKFEKIFEQGQFKVVEGEIRDFQEYHDTDKTGGRYGYWNNTFWVNDVYFHTRSNSHYYKNKPVNTQGGFYIFVGRYNGPINKNGQSVRISYVTEQGENKIIMVEIME